MSPDAHDRRGFLKQLLRGAAQTAQELASALQPEPEPEPFESLDALGYARQPTTPAQPSQRRVSLEELRELCAEVGLADQADAAVAHARVGLRLTHAGDDEETTSRLGGLPPVPDGFEWPVWRGEQLAFLAAVSLDEAAALEPSLPLPGGGLLLVFYAVSAAPDGLGPLDRGGCRVVLVEDPESAYPDARGPLALPPVPLRLTPEVTLPSESAGLPPSLELDPFELDLWQRLRERLAAAQGVELETTTFEFHALHRLLGHPDTLHEELELECQLADHGIDLNTGERYFDPSVQSLEPGAADWLLLLQLSSDDEAGLELGHPPSRLTIWIREQDLREARFDRIWARLV